MKALIIENDDETLEQVSQAFRMCLPECKLALANLGKKATELLSSESPDVVILDLNILDDGFHVLKQIRGCSQVPIITLSYARDEPNVIKALEWGADEYVVKPFRQLEFIARIKALLRRK